ncbi:MAG TPA: carboxypeptidase-like regulatory domain-containing protein [Bryobacteraceae bacterium]
MAKWLLVALAACGLHAAVIRGVVVDHQTGHPLSRTLVTVRPVAGTAGAPVSVRTNTNGAFEFPPVPAGAYLVSAARRSFAPLVYGQKRWKAAGVPIIVEAEGTAVLSLRLQRFGSIAGRVVDENDVGLPEHEIMAYRNSRPPQLAGRATTDDRGMYRLWGLEPGSYLVRTAPKKGDDDSYLPTFAREVTRVDQAISVDVEIDRQTDEVTVRPLPGRLYNISGQAPTYPQVPVTVTLVSDMGSQTTVSDGAGNFHFDSLGPGPYELYAQASGGVGVQAAYTPLMVDREYIDVRLRLGAVAEVQIAVDDDKGQAVDLALFQLMARRKDLSGDGKSESLRVRQGRVSLLPGRWDLTLVTTAGYYVARFVAPQTEGGERGRPDGWNEITAASGPMGVKFVLSTNPGVVRGTVTGANHEPVAGAPVFLEAWDVESHKRLVDLRQTRTDMQGKYQFYGLPPGNYRILSTFEYQSPDPPAMEAAKAQVVPVEEAREMVLDLRLWVMP